VRSGGDRVARYASALAGLMADPARREALGAAGPASVAPFSPEVVTDRWERIILGDG
jgi:hypothetical protein